jgi:hypothetical protein
MHSVMQLRPVTGEHRYAVAVEEGSDLWLTLWVKRSIKGEFFVMLPRKVFVILPRWVNEWDPHTSYHLDGTFHMKSHDSKMVKKQCQPLTGPFCGTEDLGYYAGHDPKSVGMPKGSGFLIATELSDRTSILKCSLEAVPHSLKI